MMCNLHKTNMTINYMVTLPDAENVTYNPTGC